MLKAQTVPVGELGRAWTAAVVALGGDRALAQEAALDAERRYAEPGRSYHGTEHVLSVLRDIATLAPSVGLGRTEQACVEAAACAHDVVYDAIPGSDERRSAGWARAALGAAGVPDGAAERVHALVLATAEHTAPAGDLGAAVLLDADLAILGSPPDRYSSYVAAVRSEYGHLDDTEWRTGRTAVLTSLAAREALFGTDTGRSLWDAQARLNMLREIDALAGL